MKNSELVMREIVAQRSQVGALNLFDRPTLLANLVFIHQVITATEGLLQAAIDASSGALREYFVDHIEEERGHAEWLRADLESAGVDCKSQPLSRSAVAMAGTQYYLVNHVTPAAMLGYMMVLECLPIPVQVVEMLEVEHGKDLLRTARFHAEHDIGHGARLLEIVDEHYCDEIMQSAVETARYLNEFVQELHHGG